MAERSPALDRICAAAAEHFSDAGYDGASLNEIAVKVGIRKASLYSHVSGKDELYLMVLEDAGRIESAFDSQTLKGEPGPDGPGSNYATSVGDRFAISVYLRLLLRCAYIAPRIHQAAVGATFERFLDVLREGFVNQLQATHPGMEADEVSLYGEAWLGIIDSLFVDLFYVGRECMERRREAMWRLLVDSLELRSRSAGGSGKPAEKTSASPQISAG